MNYYERHIGDYLKDTSHLSLLEHGVYTRLLDVYYTREIPFAPGEALRLVGARTNAEKAAVESVLAEFFCDGRQERCDREIVKYQARVEHNQRVGKLGGRPKNPETRTKPTGLSPGSENGTREEPEPNPPSLQTPVSIPKEKEKARKRATPLPDGFCLSDRVKSWAAEKGYSGLDIVHQLEALVSYAKRKGATYADWDEALMTAIREDWAKVRQTASSETPWQRSQRERAAEIHPAIARAAPGQPKTNPMEVLDGLVRIAR